MAHAYREVMVRRILKTIAGKLPLRAQQELKRWYFRHQMRAGEFVTTEPEYAMLSSWISAGDWVLDIGANVGHYTARFSELVGCEGRVFAVEPIPESFELLVANVARLQAHNVTLLNTAASDCAAVLRFAIPDSDTGLANYFQAHVFEGAADTSSREVFSLPLDALHLPQRIALAKIDVEGHELSVLRGMRHLLEEYAPRLIVEDDSPHTTEYLESLGYSKEKLVGSSNCVFHSSHN